MGFTPLDGLIMGSRCGSIDPAIIPYIMQKENITCEEMTKIMNNNSGLLALSEISSDLRDIEKEYDNGNKKAELAYKAYAYRIKKYIGSYIAIMGGVDVLVFTAGIGENSFRMRELITKDLDYLGIKINIEKNNKCKGITDISSNDSLVKVIVIPTNEEYMIALDTKYVIENNITY